MEAREFAAKLWRRAVSLLPAPVRGWIAFKSIDPAAPWPRPFNSQSARTVMMQALFERCGVERVVETGTWRGDTTAWFAAFGIPVVTAEVVADRAWAARFRLARWRNVSVFNLDSVKMIERLAAESASPPPRTLFYLDAHWHAVLPLGDEVRLVTAHFPNAIIVIDDFQVPDDPGYEFDDYGPDKRLTLDYIRPAMAANAVLYYPSTRSEDETGRRRGCVVIAALPAITGLLDGMPLLRRWRA